MLVVCENFHFVKIQWEYSVQTKFTKIRMDNYCKAVNQKDALNTLIWNYVDI